MQSDTANLSHFSCWTIRTVSESSGGMLGKVLLEIGTQSGLYAHALIAASNAFVPTIFITRVRL